MVVILALGVWLLVLLLRFRDIWVVVKIKVPFWVP